MDRARLHNGAESGGGEVVSRKQKRPSGRGATTGEKTGQPKDIPAQVADQVVRTLDEKHRAELRASRLTDAMIDASGIYSDADQAIREILGWKPKAHHWGRGMVIPFFAADGTTIPYARVKLDFPRHDRDGKVFKYESPLKQSNRAYFPRGFATLFPSADFVLVTEGEKKSLAGMQAGFATVGLVGVWSWQLKRGRNSNGRAQGTRMLIPDLASIDWRGRNVAIIFDSDAATNDAVKLAERELAKTLASAGAIARVVRLPTKLNGEKNGLDDFLVGLGDEGPAALRRLLEGSKVAVSFSFERTGSNGTVMLTARIGNEVLACEKLDLLRVKQRDAFASRLCDGRSLDRAAVDAELVRLAAQLAEKKESVPAQDMPELESGAIVRPELFHTADVSGVCVPVRSTFGSEARARWMIYLRFADGRRERRELSPAIELPDARRLLVYPIPSDPTPTVQSAWSVSARREWLDGASAPDPCDVFKRICERLAFYLDFSPESARGTIATLALWVMFTYVYPAWSAVPYLSIGGPLGSGKSTVFAVLSRIVFRAIQSSNMTAACLFRSLHELGGTLLLDEAERLRDGTPDAGDLRSVLLSGYKAGSPARRLEKVGDSFKQVAFDVFGPKALASIANPPEALASRCLRIVMFRAAPDSLKPRRRIDADPGAWQAVRDELHALALEHGPTWLSLAGRSDVVPAALAGRDFELWQPLLSFAAWLEGRGARGLLAIMQAHAEQAAADGRDDSTPDADEHLLRIIAEYVAAGTQFSLKPGDVLKRAQESDSATFSKWSARGVTAALGRYGLRTHKTRGFKTYGRVSLSELRRIEAAYALDLGLPQETYPNVPYVPQSGDSEAETGVRGVHGVHRGTSTGGTTDGI